MLTPSSIKRRPRVLIIDDDRTTRMLVGLVLKELDCDFAEASTGELGLKAVRERLPDLILLEVTMRGMDGFQLCEALRAQSKSAEVPILMLTGMDDHASIRQAFERGATDFFTKPINWTILGHRIRYMLRASAETAALRSSEQRLSTAQRISLIGEWEIDAATHTFETSTRLSELLCLSPNVQLKKIADFVALFSPEEHAALNAMLSQLLAEGRPFEFEQTLVDGLNGTRHFRHRAEVHTQNERGQPLRLVGSLQDITESKQAEARIHQFAYVDSSTGLANRTFFAAQLEAACQQAEIDNLKPAVIMMDLNRFKRINDTLGYSIGDEVLATVGARLSEALRSGFASPFFSARGRKDCIARLGGDEFGILLSHIENDRQALDVARRLQESLDEPIGNRGRELSVSGAMGVAVYQPCSDAALDRQDQDSSAKQKAAGLMINAEIAMYRAKERSDKEALLFDVSMNLDSAWRLDFENDLRRAIERNELLLHYQPKVEASSGRICGAEALIRWQHPRSGMVSPADFIPIAEEVGLIIPIGRWVLEAACKQLFAWREAGLALVPVAVNLATPHIRQAGLADEISTLLKRYDLSASLLQVEVTESLMMDDLEMSVRNLTELRNIGISIAIDDFGVGYSSLLYLKRLPINTLKIDRAFIGDITRDPDDAAIVSAILAMAHRLSLKVVAEGVETVEQLEFLRAHNCEQYQGYLFSKPVMPERFEALVRLQSTQNISETMTFF